MGNITLKKALEDSITKWKIIVDNDGLSDWLKFNDAGISGHLAQCGLCEKYCGVSSKRYGKSQTVVYCPLCPLSNGYHIKKDEWLETQIPIACCEEFSAYNEKGTERVRKAEIMLKRLEAIYKENFG